MTGLSRGWRIAATLVLSLLAFRGAGAGERTPAEYDLVIAGGRVMDPESGLDGVRNVGIAGGRIAAVTPGPIEGRERIDAGGLVVAPGFIDLHAHGQDPVSARLQAKDGVTTALEMEIGVFPVARWLASREGQALIHYGATVSHPSARALLVDGEEAIHWPTLSEEESKRLDGGKYAYQKLSEERVEEIAGLIARGLDEGGLGIGFGITYTPGASRLEILRLFQLAAVRGVPAYVHLRSAGDSGGRLGAFQEVIAAAAVTGAAVHVVHLNSTAGKQARVALEMIRGARARGLDVSTEAYPYTAGSSRIESALFDSWEGRSGDDYRRLQWPATGERLDAESFRKYREQGGWVIIHGRSEETNEWIVAQPDVMVASDGIPFLYGPAHPRGAGTFARVLGHYVRERQTLGLMTALAKMTLLPAQRVEGVAPQMKRKGRVQPGADADLTLFDPRQIIDRATYERGDAPSSGVVHLLIGGTFVVREGEIVEGVFPGRAIRGSLPAGSI